MASSRITFAVLTQLGQNRYTDGSTKPIALATPCERLFENAPSPLFPQGEHMFPRVLGLDIAQSFEGEPVLLFEGFVGWPIHRLEAFLAGEGCGVVRSAKTRAL